MQRTNSNALATKIFEYTSAIILLKAKLRCQFSNRQSSFASHIQLITHLFQQRTLADNLLSWWQQNFTISYKKMQIFTKQRLSIWYWIVVDGRNWQRLDDDQYGGWVSVSSGTGSSGQSRTKGHKTVVVVLDDDQGACIPSQNESSAIHCSIDLVRPSFKTQDVF